MIVSKHNLDLIELLLWEFREMPSTVERANAYVILFDWWLSGLVPDDFVVWLKGYMQP